MKKGELRRAKNEWIGELLVSWANHCRKWRFFGLLDLDAPWDRKEEEAFTFFQILIHSFSMVLTFLPTIVAYGGIIFPEIEPIIMNFLDYTPGVFQLFFALFLIVGLVAGPYYLIMLTMLLIHYIFERFEKQFEWIYKNILIPIATFAWIVIIKIGLFLDWITSPLFTWGVYSKKRYEERTKKKRGKKK